MKNKKFWTETKLEDMSTDQWESLCDGCGKCCLHKIQDEETQEIHYTNVACRLLDLNTCKCMSYKTRQKKVPDCLKLDISNLTAFKWLPSTCAYKLIANGKELPDWHPLLSGTYDSVHEAGASIYKQAISEDEAGPLENHIIPPTRNKRS
jgi:uncharacterized cysteine cluster protein YcgN (CxxCxxCC family)